MASPTSLMLNVGKRFPKKDDVRPLTSPHRNMALLDLQGYNTGFLASPHHNVVLLDLHAYIMDPLASHMLNVAPLYFFNYNVGPFASRILNMGKGSPKIANMDSLASPCSNITLSGLHNYNMTSLSPLG